MAAIDGPAGPSMAIKSAMDDPAVPVVVGDHLRRDRPLLHIFVSPVNCSGTGGTVTGCVWIKNFNI